MKKRRAPLNWPRGNPWQYRFTISNRIWEERLRPVTFLIFSYLCYCDSFGSTERPFPNEVAAGVHVSAETVKKHLKILANRNLVTDKLTPVADLWCAGEGKFFSLPNEIFLLRLPPSTFMVYAYLLLIEDRQTHTCHPSYNTIASATGIAKNTVMKSVSTLLEMGLITVESSSYFDRHGMKWTGNNLYTILPIDVATDLHVQQQLRQMELAAKRARIMWKLKAIGEHRT